LTYIFFFFFGYTNALAYKEEVLKDNFEKTLIKVEVKIKDVLIDIYCAHLGLTEVARILQTQKVSEIAKLESIEKGKLYMLGGDFNCFESKAKVPTLYYEQLKR
jgi:endonuclease/exonuclease/phosphatase family metal-dependent hydrolase